MIVGDAVGEGVADFLSLRQCLHCRIGVVKAVGVAAITGDIYAAINASYCARHTAVGAGWSASGHASHAAGIAAIHIGVVAQYIATDDAGGRVAVIVAWLIERIFSHAGHVGVGDGGVVSAGDGDGHRMLGNGPVAVLGLDGIGQYQGLACRNSVERLTARIKFPFNAVWVVLRCAA